MTINTLRELAGRSLMISVFLLVALFASGEGWNKAFIIIALVLAIANFIVEFAAVLEKEED